MDQWNTTTGCNGLILLLEIFTFVNLYHLTTHPKTARTSTELQLSTFKSCGWATWLWFSGSEGTVQLDYHVLIYTLADAALQIQDGKVSPMKYVLMLPHCGTHTILFSSSFILCYDSDLPVWSSWGFPAPLFPSHFWIKLLIGKILLTHCLEFLCEKLPQLPYATRQKIQVDFGLPSKPLYSSYASVILSSSTGCTDMGPFFSCYLFILTLSQAFHKLLLIAGIQLL